MYGFQKFSPIPYVAFSLLKPYPKKTNKTNKQTKTLAGQC